MLNKNTSPYDFFMNLLSIGLLYFSAGAFIAVSFSIINNIFPDPVSGIYDMDISTMSLAMLLILFPVYIWTVVKLRISLLNNPKKEDLRSRRWMIYFTMFIASALILGNFVAIVFNFLEGELTLRFLSKVVIMLLVAGMIIGFYKDFLNFEDNAKSSKIKIFTTASTLLVLGVLVAGFLLSESPLEKRLIRLDDERVNDLSNIQTVIYEYWINERTLPESLPNLFDYWLSQDNFQDPITGEMYDYNVLGERSFELCAVFSTSSNDRTAIRPYPVRTHPEGGFSNDWSHNEGHNCFERNISAEFDN